MPLGGERGWKGVASIRYIEATPFHPPCPRKGIASRPPAGHLRLLLHPASRQAGLLKIMKSICVFCGSSKGYSAIYEKSAKQLGTTLAKKNRRLVYGAGNVGLMGVIADAALAAGGEVLGVIPQFLKEWEVCHTGLTELVVTKTMHERKWIMEERSDGVIVLPGGFGTLDEFFEILTWKQLRLHNKPIGLLNVNGYYDPLLAHVEMMAKEGFLKESNFFLFCVSDDVEELLGKMAKPINVEGGKWV